MEGNKSKPRALLVFGAPCSGKSTFCEKFAKRFGLAYYDFDSLKREDGFSNKQILIILELLTRTKQTLVIEGFLNTEKERSEIRKLLSSAGYEPSLVWIQTDVSTIKNRMKVKYRSVHKAKEIYNEAVNEIEAPTEAEQPIILSGKHTFETQTKHVIAGLADLADTK